MKGSPQEHLRHNMRLKGYDYSWPGAYFITICAHRHECLFGEVIESQTVSNELGQIVQTYWNELASRYQEARLDAFVIMPNHIHGIIIIPVGAIHELPLRERSQRRLMLIPKIVGWFKMNTAKQINQKRGTAGIPVWQRNYWEYIIRNEDSLNRIREYIVGNPTRWHMDRENPNRAGEDDFDQ